MNAITATGREFEELSKSTRRPTLIPVIDKAGNLLTPHLDKYQEKCGQALVRLVEGDVVLTKHAKDTGHVLYEDMCKGRIDGIDPSVDHWSIYCALTVMVANGQTPEAGAITPEEMYHPEVIRRRGAYRNGVERIPRAAMAEFLNRVRSEGADKDEVSAERATELGLDTSTPEVPLEELLDRVSKK